MNNNFNAYKSFEDLFNANFLQLVSSCTDFNESFFKGQCSGVLTMAFLSNIIDEPLYDKLHKLVYNYYNY